MASADDKRFAKYRLGYSQLWRELEVLPSRRAEVDKTVSRILAVKSRYVAIEKATSVPWWAVAIIHKMEANCSFEKHLHNGDSLQKRTWQVPAGRPRTGSPPFTWEESAIDALRYDGLDTQRDWSLERSAYAFEKFNGWGYRKYGVPSPYLWSFTNRYARGKFVRDGVYDPSAVSQQSGAMAILKTLQQRDASVQFSAVDALPVAVDENEQLPRAVDAKLSQSRTLYGATVAAVMGVIGTVGTGVGWFGAHAKDAVEIVADIAQEGQGAMAPVAETMRLLGTEWPYLGAAALVFGCLVVLGARIEAAARGKVG